MSMIPLFQQGMLTNGQQIRTSPWIGKSHLHVANRRHVFQLPTVWLV